MEAFITLLQSKLFNFFVYYNYLKLKHESRFTPAQIEKLHTRRIRQLVKAAVKHDLYRQKFIDAGLDPAKVSTQEELERLSPLTKEEYRNLFAETVENDTTGKYKYYHKGWTSGSTGMPLCRYMKPTEYAVIIAQLLVILDANGYRVFRDASLDIRSPVTAGKNATSLLQKFGLLRKYYVSLAEPTEKIIAEINRLKPDELKGSKSMLHEVLQYADEHNLELHVPKMVVSSAEPMDAITLDLINKFFGPNAFIDIYASIETGLIANTMRGDPYKFFLNPVQYLYTILDKDGNKSNCGEMYVTSLFLKAFPMINYKQGDWVQAFVSEDGKQYLSAVEGRSGDSLFLSNGETVSIMRLLPAVRACFPYIEQYRYIQNEYDHLQIVLVQKKNSAFSKEEIEAQFSKDLTQCIGQEIKYSFEWVEKIPVGTNEKIRIFVNNIKSAPSGK